MPIYDGTSTGGTRGCGSRVKGGIYLCTGLSEHGSPLEAFLLTLWCPLMRRPGNLSEPRSFGKIPTSPGSLMPMSGSESPSTRPWWTM